MAKRDDPYAPNFELIIGGAKMDSNFMKLISEVTFEDESLYISSLTFTMRFRQEVIGGTKSSIMDMKVLSPGNLVVLRGGYGTDLNDIGAGYITDLEPNFSDTEEPTIKVTCLDQLHKTTLNKTEKGESYEGLRDSQVVSTIGERNGFLINKSDASTFFGIRLTQKNPKRGIQKRGTADFDYLKELAKLNTYDLYCKWDGKKKRFGLFFEPPKDRTKEVFEYVYGDGTVPQTPTSIGGVIKGALLSFKPTFSVTSQFTEYKVISWDRKATKKIEFSLTMDEFMGGQSKLKMGGFSADDLLKNKTAVTSGAGVRKEAFGKSIEIVSTRTFPNEQEAKKYLTNHMKNLAKDWITGNGRVLGNQYLQSRQVHKFSGLGAFFDGKYFFKKVTHKFSPEGYFCEFDVRKVLKELI